jgi:GntR family transcriptional regulator, transcriptional repressor for pyruvate dehydrogenase complex
MKLDAVQPYSMVSDVADRLRLYIEKNKLRAGERLPTEAVLVEQLQVSRSVLREAVRSLETIGLVSVRRGQGMYVGDADTLASCVNLVRSAMTMCTRDLSQFLEFRAAIECWTVRRAAERARPDDIKELTELCEQMDRSDQSYEATIQADFAFHRKLFEIAGNQLISAINLVLQQWTLTGMLQTTAKPRNHAASRRVHRAILNGVCDNDPDEAEKAMQRHMESGRFGREKQGNTKAS